MARDILRQEGIRGLYRGLNGMWVKEVPGSFIYFGSYEAAKSLARNIKQSPDLSKEDKTEPIMAFKLIEKRVDLSR